MKHPEKYYYLIFALKGPIISDLMMQCNMAHLRIRALVWESC